MIAALEWIGARARWILAFGALAALFLQDLAAVMRPLLPVLVALLYAFAMVRIDLLAVTKRALQPKRIAQTLGVTAALSIVTPVVLWGAGTATGMRPDLVEAMVYATAAPPLGSAAALCFLLGLNAAFALELTILGCFLTPLIGPFITGLLLGEAVPIDALTLSMRLLLVIAGGAALAIIARRVIGVETIAKRGSVFDGLGAVAMLVTILPILDGVTALILANSMLALGVLVLVFAINIGLQLVMTPLARRVTDADTAGAAGLIWGNRNTALYLAALPEAPMLSLFVGLYQIPMYATPLLMRTFYQNQRKKHG